MSDGIVLVGLPGSGKTTVGRLAAERLGRRFVDTDDVVAARIGMPAAAYLAARGEGAFRAVEREAIATAVRDPSAVIATGGGALLDPLNRWALWSHGRVCWLDAPDEVLLRRLAADEVPRPLLAPDPAARLARLRDERSAFYRAADALVDAERPPDAVEVAGQAPAERRLFDALQPRHHPFGPATARIVYGHGMGEGPLQQVLAEIGGMPSLIADRAVPDPPPIARRCSLNGGESLKRPERLTELLAWLAGEGAERSDPLVGLGGGTVGDLAGLVAALYARGVPYVAVPTTWLAQADAALGGKVAIDLPAAKNMVGAFWPAWAVIADTARLATLPEANLRDGMAEAIKAAIIGDPALWDLIVERGPAALRGTDEAARYAITERAARVKLAVVRRDPWESGERRQLNLGHTIGHALEVAGGYALAHGAAVAIGLRAVASIASERGGGLPHLDDLLRSLGFALRTQFEPQAVRDALRGDKKRAAGRQRWLLPMGIGLVTEVDDVTDAELERALRAIRQD